MSEELTKDAWKPKIDAELWKVMEGKSDDDLIPVWLWLYGIGSEVIGKALIDEKGFDPAIFEDPARVEKEIIKPIIKQLEEELGYEEAHRKGEDGMSPVDWAISAKAKEYRMARIEIVTREYSVLNDKFIDENIGEEQRGIIYNSRCTSTLVVEATKAEIVAYAKNKSVHDISLYEKAPVVPYLNQALTQIGADSTNGTKSSNFNYAKGYKGTDVIIGVIEALESDLTTGLPTTNGRFNPSAPQLSGIDNIRLFYNNDAGPGGGSIIDNSGNPITVTNSTHASLVTSIIVGQSVTVGIPYEGVVPLATVYQTTVAWETDVPRAIQQLVSKGCMVINFSGGVFYLTSPTAYNALDREVDELIANLMVSFVAAVGNEGTGTGNIGSPGKALNVISVGNAATKSSGTATITTLPYNMNASSSFNQVAYIPNKPDVSAPGTWIRAVQSTTGSGQFFYESAGYIPSGTSFAAPFVTGVVAQMIQQSPVSAQLFPVFPKSRLIQGAQAAQISTTSNPTADNNYLRNVSGAGLLNAIVAMNSMMAVNSGGDVMSRVFSSILSKPVAFYVSGKTVRVVIVFDKSTTSGVSRPISSLSDLDDLNLYLKNPSGTIVASSISTRNNVEILEFTVGTTGVYTFEVVPVNRVDPTDEVRVSFSWRITN